ncbi:unnamed protein product [Trichobilharzia szidati]|nr:unnamed protein product [Trichobilharzia szidati]
MSQFQPISLGQTVQIPSQQQQQQILQQQNQCQQYQLEPCDIKPQFSLIPNVSQNLTNNNNNSGNNMNISQSGIGNFGALMTTLDTVVSGMNNNNNNNNNTGGGQAGQFATPMNHTDVASLLMNPSKRAETFVIDEVKVMLKEIEARKHILLSLSPSTNRLKRRAWEDVAMSMAARWPHAPRRTADQFANVLYLEAPAGVGFSYSVNGSFQTDDDTTSENNFYALLNFLSKFPEYEKRDFYITGESYAGVYVPTLALRVINSNKFNLKGIAVGNGYTHDEFLDNSALYFAYYHGLVDEDQWNTLLTQCCQVGYPTKCLFTRNATDFCDAIIGEIAGSVMTEMNIYNIYSECEGGITPHHPASMNKHSDFGNLFRENKYMQKHRQSLETMSGKLQTRLTIPCLNDSTIREYFNSSDVRKALHVREDIPVEWDICSQEVNFGYTRQYTDLSSQYTQLLQSGVNILIYNGDTDMACNYIGDEWFVDNLNLPVEMNRTSWYYTEADGTQQVGGYWKGYKLNKSLLVYTTIHGAGHMVPQDKPVAAYTMMSIFVQAD